jgi:DNA-directed RNA polymerase specialized sigma subunit
MAGKKRESLQGNEFTMWKAWKSDPKEERLAPLMNSLQRLVHYRVNEFKRAPVPDAAVRGFANAQVVKALHTYNPTKGASVGTHVNWHLKKVRSFVVKHQNLGKIPEHRAYNITKYKSAKQELEDEIGHAPDALSLSEHLGWSQKEVGRMESELEKRDLIASKNLEPDTLPDLHSAKERDALRYIHYDLVPDERLVFEYTLGLYGKPKLSATDIAKRMGISLPKVSRLRRKIDKKLRARGV